MYHKGRVISVEVGSYLSTSTPVFVIDNGLSVGKSLESLIHHAGWQPINAARRVNSDSLRSYHPRDML